MSDLSQSNSMEWSTVSAAFKPDGALRDIYILNATRADWQAVIDVVKREVSDLNFQVGGKESRIPENVSELFDRGPNDLATCLYVPFGQSTLNCHFFSDDEIEFDLDPRHMTEQLLPLLCKLLALMGNATGKSVSLTMENMREAEILRFESSTGKVAYVGAASRS